MMTALVLRQAFTPLADSFRLFHTLDEFLQLPGVEYRVLNYHEAIGAPTYAESYGRFLRELHALYHSMIEAMRAHRDWLACIIHRTEHTRMPDDEYTSRGDEQIKALSFDPVMLSTEWVDISLSPVHEPRWGFEIEPLAQDLDDTHVFLQPEHRLGIVSHAGNNLRLVGLNIGIPESVSWLVPTSTRAREGRHGSG